MARRLCYFLLCLHICYKHTIYTIANYTLTANLNTSFCQWTNEQRKTFTKLPLTFLGASFAKFSHVTLRKVFFWKFPESGFCKKTWKFTHWKVLRQRVVLWTITDRSRLFTNIWINQCASFANVLSQNRDCLILEKSLYKVRNFQKKTCHTGKFAFKSEFWSHCWKKMFTRETDHSNAQTLMNISLNIIIDARCICHTHLEPVVWSFCNLVRRVCVQRFHHQTFTVAWQPIQMQTHKTHFYSCILCTVYVKSDNVSTTMFSDHRNGRITTSLVTLYGSVETGWPVLCM